MEQIAWKVNVDAMSLVKRKKLESKKKGKTTNNFYDYLLSGQTITGKVQAKGSILNISSYEKVFKESIENPESFWASVGTMVSWSKPWKKVLDNSKEPFTKW